MCLAVLRIKCILKGIGLCVCSPIENEQHISEIFGQQLFGPISASAFPLSPSGWNSSPVVLLFAPEEASVAEVQSLPWFLSSLSISTLVTALTLRGVLELTYIRT